MIDLLLSLILAHVMGDFVLQLPSWVISKEKNGLKSRAFYYHLAIHLALVVFAFRFDTQYWFGACVIVFSHGIIDWLKIKWFTPRNYKQLFVLDQLLHLSILFLVVAFYFPSVTEITIPLNRLLLVVLALVLLTRVGDIVMKVLLTGPEPDDTSDDLKNAGQTIGMLERMFVFGFIIGSSWTSIAFLITAKSVFRFGDLTNAKSRKLTEYVLIGTLLSFGWAILISLGYLWLENLLSPVP